MPAHGFETFSELAVSFEIGDLAVLERRAGFLHPDQHAGQPHLGETSRTFEREQHDLADIGVPVLFCPAAKVSSAD